MPANHSDSWPAPAADLAEKLRTRQAHCGVVGLGYVGLPLAVEFARVGFQVTGLDVQESKIADINAGISYIQDIPSAVMAPLVASGKLRATTDFSRSPRWTPSISVSRRLCARPRIPT